MQKRNPSPRKRLLRHVPPFLILPEDVIEVILLKLEVKSLLRFRCVSRSWLSLINSHRFVKLHLKTSTQDTSLAHHRVVFIDLNVCSLPSFLKWIDGSSSSSPPPLIIVDHPITNVPATKFAYRHLLGCCNGLLCLLSTNFYDDESFWLCNPATRVSVELPKLGININCYSRYGFGWDESSGAFKVVCQSYTNETPITTDPVYVYSSRTNSWKTVPMGSRVCYLWPLGLFVGGRLHWVIWHGGENGQRLLYAIESFNLENDEFGMIDLPPSLNNAKAYEGGQPGTWLGEIGGCLCTLFDDFEKRRVDVWVMKEYGVKDSWFKVLTFSLVRDHDHSGASQRAISVYPIIRLPGEGPNGEISIIYGHDFCIYSPTGDQVTSIATNIGAIHAYRASIYVESLVSPTPIG